LVTVPAASKVLLQGFSASADRTVRRVLGQFWIQSDQAANAELQIGAVGGMVVSNLAFTAGAASIPGPVTERSDDYWSLWSPFMLESEGVADTGIGWHGQTFMFDSKAQRKLPDGSVYVVMVENAHATFGLEILIGTSLLVSH